MVTKKEVVEKLEKVKDPEIGLNVVDLGFIREVKVEDGEVEIKMTLTNPLCPMHNFIVNDVKTAVGEIEGVKRIEVEMEFDPPWTPDDVSKEGKKKLGIE